MDTTFDTLAALRNAVRAAEDMPAPRRADMASALASFAKAAGRPLEALPTDPVALRPLIDGVTPAMAGHRPGRWRNIVSLLTAALAWAGIVRVQGRIREAPSPAWMAVLPLSDKVSFGQAQARHVHLWRFARWCTVVGIEPQAVDDAVLARFLHDLEHHSLVADPARAARDLARYWNAAVEAEPSWPQQRLTVPDNRRWYALPWDAYPISLQEDVEAWTKWLTDVDPFAERDSKPLRPASVVTRRKELREYLAALVHRGAKPEEMVDLSSVVTPAMAQRGLKFFWERADKQRSRHGYHIAGLVVAIARHWAKLPATDIDKLRGMADRLRPEDTGLTPRNAALLRKFEDPVRRHQLLELPSTLLAAAAKDSDPGLRQALMVQTAVAIELLLAVPMRLRNLHSLRLGVHLLPAARGEMQLIVQGSDVKNGVAIATNLPPECCKLLAVYLAKYRPLLGQFTGDWLFPGTRPGQPKGAEGLRAAIQNTTAKHVGVPVHPHLFRHLAALTILRHDPRAHGLVQRVLGHRSLNSTMSFYSGLETTGALDFYDGLIAAERNRREVRK